MREKKKQRAAQPRGPKTVRTYLKEFQSKQAKPGHAALYTKAAAGDLNALDKLVVIHQQLVRIIALKYQGSGIGFEELQYNGNIGLIKALHRFDGSQATSFVTYATWWIRQSILKALREEAQLANMPAIAINELWAVTDSFKLWEEVETDEPTSRDMDKLLDCNIFELVKIANAPVSATMRFLPRA